MAIATLAMLVGGVLVPSPAAAQAPPERPFLDFVQRTAADLRKNDVALRNLGEWQEQRARLRQNLERAWGGFPTTQAPLQPRILETLDRPRYTIEKIIFQTLPGVWMTANAWIPKTGGRHPAVLCVHGHWAGAKQDAHVQARSAGLATLGYFVLAVDAFGAGERAIGKELGEYHGEMTAATLWPIGRPLSGIQVYENSRAVDYLCSRPEVDPDRIGITGASGGGNQSMYAGAWDERLKAVVPVCSVGSYRAYLGAACCMCEVVPGALAFTEESGVLALIAPRALMVVSATRDSPVFAVAEAAGTIAAARPVFTLHGKPELPRHVVIEAPHDYNQQMREAMYGFMSLHLKGEGDGSPIAEPPLSLEDPETLRCYPGTSRPDDWVTLPRFAAREARRLLEERTPLDSMALRERLDRVLGGTRPDVTATELTRTGDGAAELTLETEPGVTLRVPVGWPAKGGGTPLQLILSADGPQSDRVQRQQRAAVAGGRGWAVLELRGTGSTAWPTDRIGRAPDHNTAEWSLWLGRPLCGQWVRDIRAVAAALAKELGCGDVHLSSDGAGGLAALAALGLDERIGGATIEGLLSTFVSEQPYDGQRLANMVPGMLSEVGDVVHLAELAAPRPLSLVAPVDPQGQPLTQQSLQRTFGGLKEVWRDHADQLRLSAAP